MKHYKRFKKVFGVNAYGLIDFPKKYSNVKISRISNHSKMGGCSFCFPHGMETTNSKYAKFTRNWKRYRKTHWKSQAATNTLD